MQMSGMSRLSVVFLSMGHPDGELLDLVRLHRVLLDEDREGVERRLDRRATDQRLMLVRRIS